MSRVPAPRAAGTRDEPLRTSGWEATSVSLMFLPHCDVLCDLLLNRHTATWNLFVLYNDQKEKRPIHTCLVPLDCSRTCAILGIFLSPKRYFSSLLLLFFFILIVYSFFEKVFNVFSCWKQNNGENILQNGESLVAMAAVVKQCEDFL